LDPLEKATVGRADYRTRAEREAVLRDVSGAKVFYQSCFQGSEGERENAR